MLKSNLKSRRFVALAVALVVWQIDAGLAELRYIDFHYSLLQILSKNQPPY